MKALRIHEYGGLPQLDEIERPVAGAGQVVVRNLATSFNPIDPSRASGVMRRMFPLELPWIPGGDVSGTVESVGEGVVDFKVGDQVFATACRAARTPNSSLSTLLRLRSAPRH
jgi:NADPH:quinone reductase and related Zn-dependent oxidoreductases